MVRLIKGAYWDTEIKHAQEQGFPDYSVYSRKANTVSTIIELASGRRDFEFQRLHGMGQLLYRKLFETREQTVASDAATARIESTPYALRVYAPVGSHRDLLLEHTARLLESRRPAFMALIIREAGRTIPDALSEVREAIDFCRYYAAQARELFSEPIRLPGPTGERSELSLCGRSTFVCISPWNFPLAIFTGRLLKDIQRVELKEIR